MLRRERAIEKRELSVENREHAVRDREAAVREADATIREREAAFQEREKVLTARENALARREAALAGTKPEPAPETKSSSRAHRSRTADPVDDVPALVEAYQASGGVVPLGVLVAEVEALQQAASRLRQTGAAYDVQLLQLEEREKLDLAGNRRQQVEEELKTLRGEKARTASAEQDLIERYPELRDAGVQRFTPMLLQTVTKYDAAFEGQMDEAGEAALERIGALCQTIDAKGRTLRQPLPSAHPKTALATLMLLMDLAIQAGPKLLSFVRDAIAAVGNEGTEVMVPPKPTKGLARALQKTLEEYEGDYTRLLDYARITLIFDQLPKLEAALAWLLSPARAPRFEALRTKDRLSRSWNAEMSGGNRDVMVNGWLDLGGGRRFIVEVQFHLRCLFELKGDLHVLYAGARVLGAMEDSTAQHQGKVSTKVLERAKRGVVRKIKVQFSPWTATEIEQLESVLKQEPCAMLSLEMSYATLAEKPDAHAFDGRTLEGLLQPTTGTLACRRLQSLQGTWNGLAGEITPSIAQCRSLTCLGLNNNTLTGEIPACLGTLTQLRELWLDQNKLSGPIPEALGEMHSIEFLGLLDNQLSGQVPSAALARLTKLKHLSLGGSIQGGRSDTVPPKWQQYMRERGIYYCDGSGNRELWISAAGKAEILAAAPLLQQAQAEHIEKKGNLSTDVWPRVAN